MLDCDTRKLRSFQGPCFFQNWNFGQFFLFYPSYFWAILKETRSVAAKRVIDEEKFLGILISVWFFFPDFSMFGFCPKHFRS